MDIDQIFLETINAHKMIKTGNRVIVAVSGGPDSMCLLHLLHTHRDMLDINLCVAHLDHMFRGEESHQDALFVEDFCRENGIQFIGECVNVPRYIEKTGLSPEDAARRVRYAFFEKVRSKYNAQKVALGHNRNDHEETVLMNIFRGTGLEGLVGIEPVRGNYIRPLIDVPRQSIEFYLDKHQIKYRIDRTNLTTDYFRNTLRLELIPLIQQKYCPNLGDSLRRLADIARQDFSYIYDAVETAWEDSVKFGQGVVIINIRKYSAMHVSIQRHIVRKAVHYLTGDVKDFEYRHTLNLADFIQNASSGSRIDLPKGILGQKDYETFKLTLKKAHKKISDYSYILPMTGSLMIMETGMEIQTRVKNRHKYKLIKSNPLIAQLDCDKIKGNLIVRNRRPGDRFVPLGSKYFKKLQDFFTDCKVPKMQRDMLPIIEDSEKIVWIGGLRIDDRCKITENTRNVLLLKLEKVNREELDC